VANDLVLSSNATQTGRAIVILHTLTGSIDVPGGNVHFAKVPVSDVSGNELRDAAQWQKSWCDTASVRQCGLDRAPAPATTIPAETPTAVNCPPHTSAWRMRIGCL
jgi:anaerobic selenocysteine-containing dehydrogenase